MRPLPFRVPATATLAWVLASGLSGQLANPAERFRLALRHVHETMARGQFAPAQRQLLSLLERHREKHYVFVHKADLLEDFRRCAFFLTHPAPTPGTAVSGRLERYNPQTGRVRLRYTPQCLGDFDLAEEQGNSRRVLRWHPGVFRGRLEITLTGEDYQQTVHTIDTVREVRVSSCLHILGESGEHLEVEFGNPRGTYSSRPARIVRWKQDGPEVLASAPTRTRLGEQYALRVTVDDARIRAFSGNRLVLQASRARSKTTRFAIEGVPFEQLRVRGAVDPGWVQDRVDHQRQLQQDSFDRTYDRPMIPDWLTVGGIPQRRSFNPAEAWPRDTTEAHMSILRDIVVLFDRKQHAEGLAYLEQLGRDVLPETTRLYLLARFHRELDEIDQALACCERLVAKEPGFLTGRQLRAELRVRRGQGAELAVVDYQQMIADHPKARELYVDLAVLLIQLGRGDEAAAILNDAVRKTGNSENLMKLQRMILYVTRGPSWQVTHQHRSPHYDVRSNIDADICREAAAILENAHRDFTRILGTPRRQANTRYRVFLFAGQTGYERFCQDILGERDTHTAGLYSAALQQLLIWNLPNKDSMLRTVRHEGLHQFLDSLLHDAPPWYNEGLAEYFEAAPPGTKATTTAAFVRPDHLRKLHKNRWLPTGHFLRMPRKTFYRGSVQNYAQAWATVHFLRHQEDEAWKGILPTLRRHLAAGRSPRTAVDKALAGVDLAALHRALIAWVEALRGREDR